MNYKKHFPIFKKHPDLCYFDTAASSLKLKSVADTMKDYYYYNGANIHRGVYALAADATNKFEYTRLKVAEFINADIDEVIFTKGTSHSLNMLVRSIAETLSPGDEIITSQLEHHSAILPWIVAAKKYQLKLTFIPLDQNNKITIKNFQKVLSDKTKIVALAHVSNTFGYTIPLKEIINQAHAKGSVVILDCAQSVAHTKIDVKSLGVDYLAFSAHKMYGPNGVGVLYGKKELLNKLNPTEYGGEMVFKVDNEHPLWKTAPYKFETGTPDIASVIAFAPAIEFLENIGLEKVYQHERKLHQYLLKQMLNIEGLTIYNPKADNPIILFNINEVHPHDAASILDSRQVCVRAGQHCAQHALDLIQEVASLRVSIGIYNNKKDIDLLVEAIKYTIDFFGGF